MIRSIQAFQPFFPGVILPWWEYFNSGIVVLNRRHVPAVDYMLELALGRWEEMVKLFQAPRDFGTDQTLLNFVCRSHNLEVEFLPDPFNLIHCYPFDAESARLEYSRRSGTPGAQQPLTFGPGSFDFTTFSYIWHFTNVVAYRTEVMRECWRLVSHNYAASEAVAGE